MELKRNDLYFLKKDSSKRLIFWYPTLDRDGGSTILVFVKAPMPGEKVGTPKGQFIVPDPNRIYQLVLDPRKRIEDLIEATQSLPHETVHLIPRPSVEWKKPNLP